MIKRIKRQWERRILFKAENDLYKAERAHLFQTPGARGIFLLFCICADGLTLNSLFELMVTQQALLSLIITGTVAICLNVAPMLMAACLCNKSMDSNAKKILCTVLLSVFVTLFGSTFALRWFSRGEMFVSTSQLSIVTEMTGETEEMEETEPTMSQNIIAVILGLEPLATSVLTFYLSYEADAEKKKQHIRYVNSVKLQKEMDDCRVKIQKMKEYMDYDFDADDAVQYETVKAQILDYGEQMKIQARRRLSELHASPEAVEYLMEGGFRQANDQNKECMI